MKQKYALIETVCDKNDPRVFIYKNPRRKWMGVNFNLAHAKARRVLLWGIVLPWLGMVAGVLMMIFVVKTLPKSNALMFKWVAAIMAYNLTWVISLCIYAYRMAARDAKNHPSHATNNSP